MSARSAAVDYSRSPHFFKVFFPELSSQFLSIPPAFRENLKPECPGIAALRGPSGNIWHADLAVGSNTLFFGNGWKDFVADHSIVAGDFLIFRYDGKLHFTVLLFDATACEKKCGFLATPCREGVEGTEAFVEPPEQAIHLLAPKRKRKKKDHSLGLEGSPEKKKKKKKKQHSHLGETYTKGSQSGDEKNTKSKSRPQSSSPQQKQSAFCSCATVETSISSPDSSVCNNPHPGPLELIEPSIAMIGQTGQTFSPMIGQTGQTFSPSSSNEPVQVPLRVEKGPRGALMLLTTSNGKDKHSRKLKSQNKQETIKMESCSQCSEKLGKTKITTGLFKVPPNYSTLVESSQCQHGEGKIEELRIGSLISQRRPITEKEVDETLERAQSFKSNNPSTIIVMRGGYVYAGFFLHIPSLFAREYLPKETSILTLWDPNGKSWLVKCFADARGARFSAGWAKFSYAHNLEQHDVCVFEVIERNQLKVHIYRVVEIITPLIRVSSRCRG